MKVVVKASAVDSILNNVPEESVEEEQEALATDSSHLRIPMINYTKSGL